MISAYCDRIFQGDIPNIQSFQQFPSGGRGPKLDALEGILDQKKKTQQQQEQQQTLWGNFSFVFSSKAQLMLICHPCKPFQNK